MKKEEIINFIMRQKYEQDLTYAELAKKTGYHFNTFKSMNHSCDFRLATIVDSLEALGFEFEIKKKKK